MPPRVIRGLAEIQLRIDDLDAMQAFYEEIVGLELIKRFDGPPACAFFRVAEDVDGHAQGLGLFDRSNEPGYAGLSSDHTTLDHIAFEISKDDYVPEKERLERLGLDVSTGEHPWAHRRSLYVRDPEGNLLEWVCQDPSLVMQAGGVQSATFAKRSA
jgi:catechol 2,3-dioxygenase-like lactoylglutathione lyase family enzyme